MRHFITPLAMAGITFVCLSLAPHELRSQTVAVAPCDASKASCKRPEPRCEINGQLCFGPSRATEELTPPQPLPVVVLPKGRAPVGELPKGRDPGGQSMVGTMVKGVIKGGELGRKHDVREKQAEAAYQLGVETARRHSISVDGKESYDKLELAKETARAAKLREEQELALNRSAYAGCTAPSAREGTTKCLVDVAPALCPSCRQGWRHRCEAVGRGVDLAGQWRPLEECLPNELKNAKNGDQSQQRVAGLLTAQASSISSMPSEEQNARSQRENMEFALGIANSMRRASAENAQLKQYQRQTVAAENTAAERYPAVPKQQGGSDYDFCWATNAGGSGASCGVP